MVQSYSGREERSSPKMGSSCSKLCVSLFALCQATQKNLPGKRLPPAQAAVSRPIPPPPQINGGSIVFYSASHQIGGGNITGTSGELITVTVTAGGPPSGTYSMECEISEAFSSDGSTTVTATNGSASKSFTCPSSGSVFFDGIFSESNQSGSGSISVQ
jgi:hypothetical protein